MKGLVAERYGELLYYRAQKDGMGFSRGDVVVEGRLIPAYPHIPRVLSPYGVVKNVPSALAEEKKDGYNVRVASIGGRLYAFLRSGLVDPFATALLSTSPPVRAFFAHHPSWVLNVEVVGDTPYTRPTGSTAFYAFDVMAGSAFLPVEERRRLLAALRVPQVPFLGRVERERDVIELMEALNRDCREGAVFKSPDRRKAVKLVTPCSDMEQLNSSPHLFDLPTRYVEQRLFRSALMELFLPGPASVEPLKERLKAFAKEGKVFSRHTFTVPTLWVWHEVKKVLARSKEIWVEELSVEEVEKGYRVTMRKVYRKSTRFLQAFLSGRAFVD